VFPPALLVFTFFLGKSAFNGDSSVVVVVFAGFDFCGGGFCFGQKALSNKPFRLKYLGIEGPTECRLESETHDFERRLSAGPKTRQLDWKPLATACPACSAI